MIAQELGVSPPAVRKQRVRRGIAVFPKPMWDTSLLGTMSDSLVARVVGRCEGSVNEMRQKLGIPRCDQKCLTFEGESATLPEAEIDLYWHVHEIPHKFQVRIGKYIADWVLYGNTVVEYAGLLHKPLFRNYDARIAEKESAYLCRGYDVLIIRPEELIRYDTGIIPQVKPIHRHIRSCAVCGAEISRPHRCWFRSSPEKTVCMKCRNRFNARNRSWRKSVL